MKIFKYLLLFIFVIQVSFLHGQIDRSIKVDVHFPAENENEIQQTKTLKRSKTPPMKGYLPKEQIPNSLLFLPPPPLDTMSAAFRLDQHLATQVFMKASEARKLQAIRDADLSKVIAFDSIINLDISIEVTPKLYMLLLRSTIDASASAHIAKTHYQRTRPFVHNNNYTCTPINEPSLRTDGSYPSGHTTAGWTIALILTEIFPDKANALINRGKEFGISRNICNAHWHTDVIAGRMVGSATVATLHGNEEFLSDLEDARKEVNKLLKSKTKVLKRRN